MIILERIGHGGILGCIPYEHASVTLRLVPLSVWSAFRVVVRSGRRQEMGVKVWGLSVCSSGGYAWTRLLAHGKMLAFQALASGKSS